MKKIILYEYDKRNREDFLKQLEDAGYAFLSIMVGEDIKNVFGEITTATKGFIMDVPVWDFTWLRRWPTI